MDKLILNIFILVEKIIILYKLSIPIAVDEFCIFILELILQLPRLHPGWIQVILSYNQINAKSPLNLIPFGYLEPKYPCFGWKRPCFEGLIGALGTYIWLCPLLPLKVRSQVTSDQNLTQEPPYFWKIWGFIGRSTPQKKEGTLCFVGFLWFQKSQWMENPTFKPTWPRTPYPTYL